MKILTTITPPAGGHARIMGCDVARNPLEVRRRIAVVLQQTAVDGLLTVQDNLLIYAISITCRPTRPGNACKRSSKSLS